ncbi:hypothetical protein Fmac_028576 [Flemingia macrophylla]|uniref:Uncharacterized protein n=1 Tax=Flemingia macrophylla TaxID=520843 RepID=A0ABD1L7X2_9FABA
MASNSQQFSGRNDAIAIRGVHDVATHTSAKTRKLEDKLDALVNLVTQLAANQKPASQSGVGERPEAYAANTIADHHSSRDKALDREQFSARNDAIVIRGVHDVATDPSAETRKLEGKLDSLVNLVTQLAVIQKLASVARVCDIRSSNDHHTSVCPSSQQSGVDEHPEAYAAKTYSRPPKHQRQGTCWRRWLPTPSNSVEETMPLPLEEKLEGKLDALVNLVTQLATNQKSASIAKVYEIRSSNDHHTSVYPSSQQSGVDEHPEAYAANTYSRPPQQQRQGT